MGEPIYLDHSATTPVDQRVVETMEPYFRQRFANPSSLYRIAQDAREAVEEARERVARLLHCSPAEIVFTSGGSEANNLAIKGVAHALQERGNHIITSQIEHHAVLNPCGFLEENGFRVSYLPSDSAGVVDPDGLRRELRKVENSSGHAVLVSIMHANNEVGTIQSIREMVEIAKERDVYFHTDAIQTVGKIPVDVDHLGVDLLSLSGHKFYGPKGVGALYIRKGTKLSPLIHGGHHEASRRAGTENVPGVVGLGKACEIALAEMEQEEKKTRRLRDRLARGIEERVDDVLMLGHPEKRLPGTAALCVRWVEGESILLLLDAEGIAISSGSACTSGSLEPSHVLKAMGVEADIAHGSLRFSLGQGNSEAEIDRVLEVFPAVVRKLRAMSPFGGKG